MAEYNKGLEFTELEDNIQQNDIRAFRGKAFNRKTNTTDKTPRADKTTDNTGTDTGAADITGADTAAAAAITDVFSTMNVSEEREVEEAMAVWEEANKYQTDELVNIVKKDPVVSTLLSYPSIVYHVFPMYLLSHCLSQ